MEFCQLLSSVQSSAQHSTNLQNSGSLSADLRRLQSHEFRMRVFNFKIILNIYVVKSSGIGSFWAVRDFGRFFSVAVKKFCGWNVHPPWKNSNQFHDCHNSIAPIFPKSVAALENCNVYIKCAASQLKRCSPFPRIPTACLVHHLSSVDKTDTCPVTTPARYNVLCGNIGRDLKHSLHSVSQYFHVWL